MHIPYLFSLKLYISKDTNGYLLLTSFLFLLYYSTKIKNMTCSTYDEVGLGELVSNSFCQLFTTS